MRGSWRQIISYFPSLLFAAGTLLGVGLLLFPATSTYWGERHEPHGERAALEFSSGHSVQQTFLAEAAALDAVILEIAGEAVPLPTRGALVVRAFTAGEERVSQYFFHDIPPSGMAVFTFTPPLPVRIGEAATLEVTVSEPGIKTALRYQIDDTIYADGKLTYRNSAKHGDLAFQLRYVRPPLGGEARHLLVALALLVSGVSIAWLLFPTATALPAWPLPGRDTAVAAGLGLVVTIFYALLLLRPGIWVGAGDFSKDAAYLAAAAASLREVAWPVWSHATCGGMALLGNPEGNTVSIGTLLALILPADRALLLMLALEAGIGASGMYVLGRLVGLRRAGSVAAAAIALLSGAYAYRIVEGWTQLGGVVAFFPWALVAMQRILADLPRRAAGQAFTAAMRKQRWWILTAGMAVALILLRGDVHVVIGVILVIVLGAGREAWRRRQVLPLAALVLVGSATLLPASVKIIPFLEQPQLIGRNLHPYVALLVAQGELDDVLLRVHDREHKVVVRHGEFPVHFGTVGAYVGLLPLLLAGGGLFVRHRYRRWALGGLIVTFLLSEGTLFEFGLRHLPLLDTLLRMPTRLLALSVVFLGLLAGMGLDALVRQQRVPRWVALGVLCYVILDLGYASSRILVRNMELSVTPPRVAFDVPMQVPHQNISPDHDWHATKLARGGHLLPHICGDQNNPPRFITELTAPVAVADFPTRLTANHVALEVPSGPADIIVRERFTPAWVPSIGHVREAPEGSVHLIVPAAAAQTVRLTYHDPLLRAEQVLAGLLGLSVILLMGQVVRYTLRYGSKDTKAEAEK